MSEDRKYRYGLKNTKYAIWNPGTSSYGELKELPGAVSLTLSAEGGDGSDFYADDGIWATFPGTNGGYSGTLELANIPDQARVDLLCEIVDSASGVQFETTDAEPPEFALITEAQTNIGPIGTVLYSVKATRPEFNANTKGENVDVDTETLTLRIGAREFTYDGDKKKFVKGTIQKNDSNAAKYAAFFESVVTPGGDSSESALSA
jgi:phi13 family phage major tail protein